jgi:hypothetical protein
MRRQLPVVNEPPVKRKPKKKVAAKKAVKK